MDGITISQSGVPGTTAPATARVVRIKRIVREIVSDASLDSEEKSERFKAKFPKFSETYPILFDMSCKNVPGFENKLEFMLRMLGDVEGGEVTQHNASAAVGQMLYDEYVKPVVEPSS